MWELLIIVYKNMFQQEFHSLKDFGIKMEEVSKLNWESIEMGTSKRYRTTQFHIEKYLKRENKSDLTFSEMTSSFIEGFET